jgi:hypothetical protein
MSARDYVFVVGCPRSGTTLLAVMLDRHTRLSVPPETSYFDEVAPRLAVGEPLRRVLGAWPRLVELNLDPDAVLGQIGETETPAEVLAALLDLYAAGRGKARSGEKTPQHLPHVPRILEAFPQARVVCLLRDGRDTALSLNAMPWWQGGLTAAVEMWRDSARWMEELSARHPDRFRVVRYEELVARPREVLGAVMDFVGETFELRQLDPRVPSDVIRARSMEWKGRALAEVDPRHGDRRRRAAARDTIAEIEGALGRELRRHGYA